MNKTKYSLFFFGVLCFLFSFQNCSDSLNKNIKTISIPNDDIKGKAFIGESRQSVYYSPQGNFIQVYIPHSGIWTELVIEKSHQIIIPKLFIQDDKINTSLIFDSLSIGQYHLKYISELKDTIQEKLRFEKNIELTFPEMVSDYYDKKDIKHLNIENLTRKDTLQILYKNYGCFGGFRNLIEFISNEEDELFLRKKIYGLRYEDEPEDQWIYSKGKDIKEKLLEFVSDVKKLQKIDLDLCSSQIEYIFRIKGENSIYWVEDKSCKLLDEIAELINTR
ncbi:hypothetical protein [Winogradskyella sp. 3972H.M.0a.05]|uniref:hypothetical protein n=1 Tax=Winogradskyella sp. 3972H.M.0a.05 TaxID=2950277 RepID=UPI00339B1D64